MSDENQGAAAPAPEQAAPSAPAVAEQAKPDTSVNLDAVPDAETEAKPQGGADTGDKPEGDEDDKPTKLTRNQRLQRKAARLATMLADREAELETLRTRGPASADASEPKEADYNGDFFAYQRALTAYEVKQALRTEINSDRQRTAAEKQAELRREQNEEFFDRTEDIKTRVPDFDAAFETFAKAGGTFAQHVVEELTQSEHGPLLAYQLAKNPLKAAELNAMSARDAAREIGRLESKVSLPNPKTRTSAPPPLRQIAGGANPTKNPAEMSMDEYVAWRKGRKA